MMTIEKIREILNSNGYHEKLDELRIKLEREELEKENKKRKDYNYRFIMNNNITSEVIIDIINKKHSDRSIQEKNILRGFFRSDKIKKGKINLKRQNEDLYNEMMDIAISHRSLLYQMRDYRINL